MQSTPEINQGDDFFMHKINNYSKFEEDVRRRINEIIDQKSADDEEFKKLTNKRISEATGISKEKIKKMRNGGQHLSHSFIEEFAKAYLDGDICYLYTGITDPTPYKELGLSSDFLDVKSNKEGYSDVEFKFFCRLRKKYHTMNNVANRFSFSSTTLYDVANHKQNLTINLTVEFANKGIDIYYLLTGIKGLKDNDVLNSRKRLSRDEQIEYLKGYKKQFSSKKWFEF